MILDKSKRTKKVLKQKRTQSPKVLVSVTSVTPVKLKHPLKSLNLVTFAKLLESNQRNLSILNLSPNVGDQVLHNCFGGYND